MFFALSKILRIFIMPFWWLVFLAIWMIFTRSIRVRKRLAVIICVLVVLLTNPFLFKTAALKWQPEPEILPKGTVYEAGIVLGGLSFYDKYDRGFFGPNADRFIGTANLYHQGIIKKIVISGGTGKFRQNEPSEAFFLRDEFIKNGVQPADIILESRSRNTYENAIFTKAIVDSAHIKPPYVLITSAMHMRRSSAIFKKAGYQFVTYPVNYLEVHKNFEMEDAMLPDIGYMKMWSMLVEEMVGYGVYKITGKL